MATIPSECPHCGHAWSSGIALAEGASLTIENSRDQCPRCGRTGAMTEGTFTARDGVVEMLSGTDVDRQSFSRLVRLAEALRAGQVTIEDAERQVLESSGTFEEVLKRAPAAARKTLVWILLHTILILAAYEYTEWRSDSVSPREIERIVQKAIEQHDDESPDHPGR